MEVARRRLAGQFLTGARARTAQQVVRALAAVQAQEYLDAKWALALRTRGLHDADVEKEMSEGRILRTHVLRPTWHFVAAEDIRWLLALTGPRVNAMNAARYRDLEIDAAVVRKTQKLIAGALEGERYRTRSELRSLLEQAGIETKRDNRLSHILMRAELDGLICSGPRAGKESNYALIDERVPPSAPVERDQALRRLALCYFTTRGPATAQDFSWWSGLTIADVKRAIDIAGAALERAVIDDRPYWSSASRRRLPSATSSVQLLPIYDEYYIGHRDRSAIGRRLAKATPGIRGEILIARFIIVDGQIAGRWQRRIEKQKVIVHYEWLTRITQDQRRRIDEQAQRFARFLGLPVATASSALP